MKELLQSKLEDLKWLKENAGNWEYYLGQYNLCLELLEVIEKQEEEYREIADQLIDNKYPESDKELPF
jgi:hypothetical protein